MTASQLRDGGQPVTWRGVVARLAVAIAVVAGVWVLAARRAAQQAEQAERDAGSALFHGTVPLIGRLAGHEEALPTLATRCSNCHEAVATAPRVAAAGDPAASGSYARRLDGNWLTQLQQRHGGPPSAYDTASFCRLLRSGVDPVSVMIPSAMPRYAATDAQCHALWSYLAPR